MSIRLDFEIALCSDYHVGAGYGLGSAVDSALLRDADNIPVMRGTMLNGLLRQGLYDLLQLPILENKQKCQQSGKNVTTTYCGQWHSTEDPCPICAVFGSPSHMKRWRFSSARPAELITPQRNHKNWHPGETAAQINTRVRVNPRTRRAANNQLFSQETGDGRLRFRFSVDCLAEDAAAWAEAEWLVAAARMVRHLGSARRRGRGECEISLVKIAPILAEAQSTILDRFAARLQGRPPVINLAPHPQITPLPKITAAVHQPYRLRVWMRLDEPLLVSRRADTGNQFETVQSIPGTVLRGALAWRIAHRFGAKLDNPADPIYQDFVTLLFSDAVRFSSLLPLGIDPASPNQAYLSIAAPKDLVTCELHPGYSEGGQHGHEVWSKTNDESPEYCPHCHSESTGEKVQVGVESLDNFITLNRGGLRSDRQPRQSVEMHISVNPVSGRVKGGELFGFVTLDAGQYFMGEIVCADKDTWTTLRQMTGLKDGQEVNTLRIGKASRRGHGKVSVICTESTHSPWHGADLAIRVTDPEQVIVTLLSDTIIVDDWGRAAQGFANDWLHQELGLPQSATVQVFTERAFSTVRGFQSFNAKLGLPKYRDTVLAAGSTTLLQFKGIDLAALQDLLRAAETKGIGLRRNEGFGVVAFNHAVHQGKWSEGFLNVPDGLSLETNLKTHKLTKLRDFEKEWGQILDNIDTKRFAQSPLEASARILQTTSGKNAALATERLEHLGEQTQVLTSALKGRDKTNFYKEGDGEPGMKIALDHLKKLETLIQEQEGFVPEDEWQLWKIGMERLAERIAGPARQKTLKGN